MKLPIELIWLPTEDELQDATSLDTADSPKQPFQKKVLVKIKSHVSKLINLPIELSDFKKKIVFSAADENAAETKDRTPLAMFYSEYLFKFTCVIDICQIVDDESLKRDKYKKIIKLFSSDKSADRPQIWLYIDASIFIDKLLSTVNDFYDLNNFSLGNIVGLNKFVEHFSSKSSLDQHNYKITQVKIKFLHDEQELHMNFVVRVLKVNIKKASAKTHRLHRLVVPYSSIHTILLCHNDDLAAFFRLYKSPLLSAVEQKQSEEFEDDNDYISYQDLTTNTDWVRTVNIFENCPKNIRKEFSMNNVLKVTFHLDDYEELLKIMLHHKSVQIYFTSMNVVSYKCVQWPCQFDDFNCFFASQCLLTQSYEILDNLMEKKEMEKLKTLFKRMFSENPKALSDALYLIHSAISQCNTVILNYSIKYLYDRFSQIGPVYNYDGIENDTNKHNLLLIKRAVVTPTHVRLLPPQPILKSRALRDCNPEFSLRISIRDVNNEQINFSFKAYSKDKKEIMKDFFNDFYKKPMLEGIKVGKRTYYYVGSSTSQLRGHGLWFYAEDDKGNTAKMLRQQFGNLEKIKQVPKFMARMGQTFSQAMTFIKVPKECTNVDCPEKDVTGGVKMYLKDVDLEDKNKFLKVVDDNEDLENKEPYVFSDGIGRVSQEIAAKVYQALDLEETKPSAIQIRYAGCKGMLVVDPNLKGEKIIFRESMKKYDSTSDSLEILKLSDKRAACLNRPLITILEQLGVAKETFIKIQKDMIQSHIRSMFHEIDACTFLNRNSQLRFDFLGMHKVGIRFTEDPLFRSMIYGIFRKQLDLLKSKANIEIPLNKGRSMFGVLDETFTLEYGQVFVQYSDWFTNEPKIVEGTIVVTKNPCMHPGDVRKFKAIDVEKLHHIKDCIVFPAKGERPHPDEMAGSDLDGDEYHVMWMEDLIFERDNADAMLYDWEKPKGTKGQIKIKNEEETIEPEDELTHLCNYIVYSNVGLIANAHLAWADKHKVGIFSDNCIRLAQKYAIALDFAKSGIPATQDKKDRVFSYPDFMQKLGTKKTYISKKALGVLYRNCKCLEMGLEVTNSEVEYKVDMDLIYKNWEKYKKPALKAYKKYCQKVEYMINIYSFNNEGELLAGAIVNPPQYYEQRHDLDNLKVLLEYELRWIFSDLEKNFFREFGGKPVDKRYTEEMFQKASAYYAVTYMPELKDKKYCYFGLPWAVSDVLQKIKSLKCSHKGYKAYNKKSLLSEIVDKNLKPHMPPGLSEESDPSYIYENRLDILDVALRVLKKWLKTQKDIIMNPNFKEFEKLVVGEFDSISNTLMSCTEKYIENLKANNKLTNVISPFHYILETLLSIASIRTSKLKQGANMSVQQELGLLSWVTLIKLSCSYNPQYLGIAGKDGKYASSIFYVPQENVISTFRVNLFDSSSDQINANQEFSYKLLRDPDNVTEYLKNQTKLKDIDFRYVKEEAKSYFALFTVMGSRYAIEKLKDFIVQPDFFSWVQKEQTFY